MECVSVYVLHGRLLGCASKAETGCVLRVDCAGGWRRHGGVNLAKKPQKPYLKLLAVLGVVEDEVINCEMQISSFRSSV